MKNTIIGILWIGHLSLAVSQASGSESREISDRVELAEVTNAREVQVFPSRKGSTWYLPLALRTELFCSQGLISRTSSCVIKVFNDIQPDTAAQIEAMVPSGSALLALTPLTRPVISVTERFEKGPSLPSEAQEMHLASLQPMGKRPYASLSFRMDAKEVQDLQSRYEFSGLGTFHSEVTLEAEDTFEFLALKNPGIFRDYPAWRNVELPRNEIRKILAQYVTQAGLDLIGIVPDRDAVQLASRLFQIKYLGLGQDGMFRLLEGRTLPTDRKLILLDVSQSGIRLKCQVRVQLKKDASSVAECAEVTGGSS